ncbi:hypothetical protein RvY_18660 [Ramazzottius varieornatus]|uniref:Uncharacterized protein n=1 Tax=Ramazzottius varieornatus TaxID=947166 RepID=A0A1D1W6P3_RAMVA|nr:hypothetical protein RvY_18660 [Ramazzottius varieornatus]
MSLDSSAVFEGNVGATNMAALKVAQSETEKDSVPYCMFNRVYDDSLYKEESPAAADH